MTREHVAYQDLIELLQVLERLDLYVEHRNAQPDASSSLLLIPFYFACSAQAHTAVILHKSGRNEGHRAGRSWNTYSRA